MISRIAAAFIALLAFTSLGFAADTYTVKRGNNLAWIASQNNVGREAMILANEALLKANYEKSCDKLSAEFRNRNKNDGAKKGGLFYCNDGYNRPYGNTLKPGMKLAIPADSGPVSIQKTVSEIQGKRIAVVIDETGSTSSKREKIGEFYLAELRKYEREIVGIWLFKGPGKVRKIDATGVTNLAKVMQNGGGFENTHEALKDASEAKPDVIILITDEPGDDIVWSDIPKLPPVIAHCLPDPKYDSCIGNLKRIAAMTKGRYIEGLSDSSTASRR